MFKRDLFSAMLRWHIDAKNLSLRDAAQASSVSASTLSRITKGEAPDIDTFTKLVIWMGTDANGYFGVEGEVHELDPWTRLRVALYELHVEEIADAIVQIVEAIRDRENY